MTTVRSHQRKPGTPDHNPRSKTKDPNMSHTLRKNNLGKSFDVMPKIDGKGKNDKKKEDKSKELKEKKEKEKKEKEEKMKKEKEEKEKIKKEKDI